MLGSKSLLFKQQKRKRKNGKIKKSKRISVSAKEETVAEPCQIAPEEEEEEEEEGFSLKSTAQSDSYGVQPLGNLYFNPSSHNSRNTGLGNLQTLTDELVLDILGLLEGTHLGILSTVSKGFYIFCNHEPLWRNLVLETCKGGFLFKGCWRSTFISAYRPSFPVLSFGLKLETFILITCFRVGYVLILK